MMATSFIQDHELIKEDCKSQDLFDFSSSMQSFKSKIDSIQGTALIGLVGKFGSGKSTMIDKLQSASKKEDAKWIHFDAWKYPERYALWEGFLLDFAQQSGQREKVIKKIDGKKSTKMSVFTNILTLSAALPGPIGAVVNQVWERLVNTSPAKRVFEIQEFLKELINNQLESEIFIVLEDVDRAGSSGIFFLETLQQFLRNAQLEKRVIAIAPISDQSYYDNLDSYIKCVDYFEFFNPIVKDLSLFVDKIFKPDLFIGQQRHPATRNPIWTGSNIKKQTISFLEALFRNNVRITPRLLKIIIRKADITFGALCSAGYKPDFRVVICFESMKYHYEENKTVSYFTIFKESCVIPKKSIYAVFLNAIANDSADIYDQYDIHNNYAYPRFDCKIVSAKINKESLLLPWYRSIRGFDGEDDTFFVYSIYTED